MAGRNTYYYCDWTHPDSGYRYRLIVTPPNTAGVAMTGGTAPAWGDTTGTAGYEYISPLAIEKTTAGEMGFPTKRPIGMTATPTREITFDLKHLAGSDLLTYLTSDPVKSDGISYAVGSSSYTLTASTTPVITLMTDFGNSGLSVDNFELDFQGAMVRNPNRSTAYNSENDTALRSITFIEIIRAVWESIEMEALAQLMVYSWNTTTQGRAKSGKFSRFYDMLWEDAGTAYGVCAATRGDADDKFNARLFSLTGLFGAIRVLTEQVYVQYIRTTLGTNFFIGAIDSTDPTTLYQYDGTDKASAYDYIRLYRRKYTFDNNTGTVIASTYNFQSKENVYFIGALWQGSANYSVGTTDLGTAYDDGDLIGGYLVANDPASIHQFTNMFDYMVDLVGGGGCKARYRAIGPTTAHLWFAPCGSSLTADTDIDIDAEDIIGVEGNIVEGAEAGQIRAFRCSYPDVEGEDVSEMSVATEGGTIGDGEMGITLHFHNAPYLGTTEEFFYHDPSHNSTKNTDFSGTHIAYGYNRYSCRRLYYFDTPSFMATEVPILCHELAYIATGWGTTPGTLSPIEWLEFATPADSGSKTFGSVGGAASNSIHAANLKQYRGRALTAQTGSGIAYALAFAWSYFWSRFNMWRAEFVVEKVNGKFEHVGGRYRLVDEIGTLTGLPILAPTALDGLSSHPAIAHCVSIVLNDDDTATLTLLGIPS